MKILRLCLDWVFDEGKVNGNAKVRRSNSPEWLDRLAFPFPFPFPSLNLCSKYSLKEYKMCASASGQTTKWLWKDSKDPLSAIF